MEKIDGWGPLLAGFAPDLLGLTALLLVAGALVAEMIARTTRLPRVMGYTIAGFAAAAAGLGVGMPLQGSVRLAVDLAMAVLLFEIGSRVRLRWLARNPGLLATSLLESAAAAGAVYAAMVLMGDAAVVAAACAVLAVPASAAVAGRVALELRAEGQVTQRMTHLVALNTLYGVLALAAFMAALESARQPEWITVGAAVAVSAVVSLALAAALGGAAALAVRHLDLRSDNGALLVLGLWATRALGGSTLLVPLLAGLLLRNTTDRVWAWPRHFGSAGGVLVLILFLVAGSVWTPQGLALGGLEALALIAARSAGRGLVVAALSRWSRISWKQGVALGVALTPMSATVLVMLSELMRAEPGLAAQVAPVVLAAVVILELAGPPAVQLALRMAGEVPGQSAPIRKEQP